MTPLVSVLMPAYNAERYVAEAVQSILDQTFTDFELIVIDDGSTDSTRAILERFTARDSRIHLSSRANRGVAATRNECLALSRGEFIAVLDSDDVALPDRLARQLKYLDDHPDCLALGSRALIIDPEGDPLDEWFIETSHEAIDAKNIGSGISAICHSSVLMRRADVLAVGGYRDEAVPAEDLDLWLRLAEHGRLANLPETLTKYRVHDGGISRANDGRLARGVHVAITEARRRRGLETEPVVNVSESPESAAGAIVDPQRKWGWWALGAGHVRTARKHARRGFAAQPFSLESWRLLYCALRGR